MVFLSVIALILVFGLPIAAIVMSYRAGGRLEQLERRIAGLETALAGFRVDDPKPTSATKAKQAKTDTVSEKVPAKEKPENASKKAEPPGKQASKKPKPKKPPRDLETLIGTRWTVLLGGFTLALGVVFLVRHSIEAGLLGPRARIVAGAVFSVALLAAGEWLRRHDRKLALPVIEKADVPAILTGAGVVGAFATLYAAHALYGFVGPAVAFVALTVIGLASLVLSALHGPALAAIGILGAYATPLLVSADTQNNLALALHVLAVTSAVMAVARMRKWLWLAIAGVAASCLWTVLAAISPGLYAGVSGLLMVCGLAAVFVVALGWEFADQPKPPADRPIDRIAVISFALLGVAFLVQLAANNGLPDTATGILTAMIIIGAASVWPGFAPIAIIAGVIALATIAESHLPWTVVDGLTQTSHIQDGLVPPDTFAFMQNALLIALPPAALAVWGAWRSAPTAPKMSGWLTASSGVIVTFGLIVAYLRIAPFETRPMFGAAGLLAGGVFVALTETFTKLRPGDMTAPAPAAYAVAAVAVVSFAIGVSLDTGWMPLAFALTSLGIAVIYKSRPVFPLPWLSLAAAGLSMLAIWFNAPFYSYEIGTMPLLNGLILIVGLPAAALVAAGELMRRLNVREPSVGLTAIGLALSGFFVGIEIQHSLNGGVVHGGSFDLAELSAQTLAALGFAIGLQRIAKVAGASIYDKASLVAGAISVAFIALGLLAVYNPAFTNDSVGEGRVFNLLLPGYLLTAIVAAAVAWLARPVRPRWYTLGYAALSGLLLFAYCSLMLRKGFHGERLGLYRHTSDIEFWYYSVLWLAMGAAVLALGLKIKSAPVRAASGILIALTVCKVFLLDMSELTGALRAFSFIGLGISLLVIGRFYQRLLLGRSTAKQEE